MADPYRYPRGGRGVDRYDYQDQDYDYGYGGRGAAPPNPGYDPRYRDPYGAPPYESEARPGAPRDYRPPEGTKRPAPEYGRRTGDYSAAPPARPRDPYADPYQDPYSYPPATGDRSYRPPPQRDPYRDPSYQPETYDYSRRRRDDDFIEPPRGHTYPPPREYPAETYPPFEEAPPGRRPAPNEYRPAPYDPEPVRVRRVPRDPPVSLPPVRPDEPYHEFTLPAEGIRKEVLQRDLTLFLGGDATMRGPIQTESGPVYKYAAYRQLTSEQVRDLKAKSARFDIGFPRGRDEPAPRIRDEPPMPMPTRGTAAPRRGRPDEDPMMGGLDPSGMDERPIEYTYGSAAAPAPRTTTREPIRTGRTREEPYPMSYAEAPPPRHGQAMRNDSDDEMET
ncbi:hypothetical protein ABW19_dt0205967 [Dactylella cylindrospora]|nr:hypothetical protein ABW19_dt0205967 [Dactylella cylindrospora]